MHDGDRAGCASEQAAGRLSGRIEPRVLATALVALMDGLQAQWLFDPELDMGDVVAAVLAALGAGDSPDQA